MGTPEDILLALRFIGWISKYQTPLGLVTAMIDEKEEAICINLVSCKELGDWVYDAKDMLPPELLRVTIRDLLIVSYDRGIANYAWNCIMHIFRELNRAILKKQHLAKFETT